MSPPRHLLQLLVGLFTLTLAAGCASKPAVRPEEGTTASRTAPATGAAVDDGVAGAGDSRPEDDEEDGALEVPPLYFALDSSLLLPQSQETLQQVAERLRKQRSVRIQIEGHSCELGTTEYNLALGMKRAEATRSYLARLGVDPERIVVTSFGEERPALEGESEAVWSKNRRSELKVTRLAHSGQ